MSPKGLTILAEEAVPVEQVDAAKIDAAIRNLEEDYADAATEAAKASEFGQILVNGTFTFALMVGLSVGDTTLGTLVANLGYDKLVMPKPVFIGDTLRAETEVIALKESKSRPNAGVVTFLHRCINQRDEIVCQCERAALLKRSSS